MQVRNNFAICFYYLQSGLLTRKKRQLTLQKWKVIIDNSTEGRIAKKNQGPDLQKKYYDLS